MATPDFTGRLSICGLRELAGFSGAAVTHVLSILDPDHPEPADFAAYGPHRRLTLRFDDIIAPQAGMALPERGHIERLLEFGDGLAGEGGDPLSHLLVHCHAGVSRSTASMAILLAESGPRVDEDAIFARLRDIRPQAWPNSLMISFADEMLGREGRLLAALRRHYAEQLRRKPELAEMLTGLGRETEVEMGR